MKKIVCLLVFLFLAGCGSSGAKQEPIYKGISWYWQLQVSDAHPLKIAPAAVYDIDLFETPKATIDRLHELNKTVICYFSAGSYENWRPDSNRFSDDVIGNPYEGWEGEYWLDIRSQNVRSIMLDRLDLAVQKGCDGVEPDNVDGYANDTGLDLSYNDQIAYNRFLADAAHKRGLLIGLKNDGEQVKDLVNDFDFAVVEECFYNGECSLYTPFLKQNKAVLDAEYSAIYKEDVDKRNQVCEESWKLGISTLFLNISLDGAYVDSCDYGKLE